MSVIGHSEAIHASLRVYLTVALAFAFALLHDCCCHLSRHGKSDRFRWGIPRMTMLILINIV